MKSHILSRIVPVSMCVCALSLPGCDRTDTSTTVKPANNPTTQQPAADPKTEAPALATSNAAKPDPGMSLRDSAAPNTAATADAANLTAKPTNPPSQRPISTTQIVKAEPAEVDLGDIPTNDSKAGKVRLINTGDTPMTIISARPSCGCTALKFVPNTVIEPKSELEIEVQMNGGMKAGPIHGKIVTFVVEGQPEVIVTLKGQAVTFVVSEPALIEPEKLPEGEFVLKSIDNEPFQVMSVQPPVIDVTEEKAAEHHLKISWEKYREVGVTRQLVVYLNHPKCNQVFMNVQFPQAELLAAHQKASKQRDLDAEALRNQKATPPPQPVTPDDPDTVLSNLIKEGKNVEVMERLQSGLDPNYRDGSGNSLLGMAAKAGNGDLIKALLATGKVDLNSTDNVGRTPLMHAAASKNADSVRVLLDAGADVATRDNLGTTALSWAAWLGNSESVQELVDKGSDVEVVSTITGWTPLMLASAFGEPGAVETLLKVHANYESADMLEGATPLIHAARTGQPQSLQLLIKAGANLEMPDRNGNTPLMACAKTSGGDAEKLKILLDAGANVHAKDNRGLNALDLARKRTDMRAPDVIKLLEPLLGAETPAAASNEPKPAGS